MLTLFNTNKMLKKETILKIKNIYTANAFHINGNNYVGAGSETDPEVKLYDIDSSREERIPDCPGGMMSFLPVPDGKGKFVSIMGLFPPFIGGEAGLFFHRFSSGVWSTIKAMELPFAHRCEFIRKKRDHFLIAATVSSYKENPSDWANPGELHVIDISRQEGFPWRSEVLDQKLFRNHGMTKTILDGEEVVCVSGAEGIFSIHKKENDWQLDLLFPHEASEMSFIDLDGDGIDELVTIEPFHGNTLCMYKKIENEWRLLFSDTLSFGHGLSAGMFQGKPRVAVGNRSGSLSLEIFSIDDLSKGNVIKSVIESMTGPTQTQFFSAANVDYILSANQRKNEVAIYSGKMEE
jgi:hypothetical protein